MLDELSGEYNHVVDDRGRLAIPAKLREKLGSVLVVTNGWDKCLYGYSEKAWRAESARAINLPTFDRQTRNLHRFMFARAAECEIDKQGRILVPVHLRAYAGLSDAVTILGCGHYMEIWDTATWEKERETLLENAPVLARSLGERRPVGRR